MATVLPQYHEKMLRLVAKGFFNELINYGVNEAEVVTVAGHLLDQVIQTRFSPQKNGDCYNRLFTIQHVRDEWASDRRLNLHEVSLVPLRARLIPQVAKWLDSPAIRDGFYPPFPSSTADLRAYFKTPGREYFTILYQQIPAGIIGAENVDPIARKLEMRKLIGDPAMHGKGIGKRATFLFLYHVFVVREFQKVYLHSLDINLRNLNLNGKFGFEVEGVFIEDVLVQDHRQDVIRMALTDRNWRELFG